MSGWLLAFIPPIPLEMVLCPGGRRLFRERMLRGWPGIHPSVTMDCATQPPSRDRDQDFGVCPSCSKYVPRICRWQGSPNRRSPCRCISPICPKCLSGAIGRRDHCSGCKPAISLQVDSSFPLSAVFPEFQNRWIHSGGSFLRSASLSIQSAKMRECDVS